MDLLRNYRVEDNLGLNDNYVIIVFGHNLLTTNARWPIKASKDEGIRKEKNG